VKIHPGQPAQVHGVEDPHEKAPEVAPEVTPEEAPDSTPEVAPESTPDVVPQVASEGPTFEEGFQEPSPGTPFIPTYSPLRPGGSPGHSQPSQVNILTFFI
jgi:hypothetical protein